MKKVVLFLGGLLIIALIGVYLSVGSLVKTAVEKGGTYALGVETTLDSANVNLLGGHIGLNGLAVRNPPGFEGDRFLQVREAQVVAPLTSLTADRVTVTRILLDGITLSLEARDLGESNYGVLLENLKELGRGKDEAPDAKPAPPSQGGGKEYIVEKIVITDVTAEVRYTAGGATLTETSVQVSTIELEDVGPEGLTVSELTALVLRAILTATLEQGDGVLPGDLLEDLEGRLDELGEAWLEEGEEALLDAAKELLGGD